MHTFLINWDFISKLEIAEESMSSTTGQQKVCNLGASIRKILEAKYEELSSVHSTI